MIKDYYSILGIGKDATNAEIEKAYKREAKAWHPDKFIDHLDKAVAEERMRLINESREVLIDSRKRKEFDTTGTCKPTHDPVVKAHGILFEFFEFALNNPQMQSSELLNMVEEEIFNRINQMKITIININNHIDNVRNIVKELHKGNKDKHHLFDASKGILQRFQSLIEGLEFDIKACDVAINLLNVRYKNAKD